MCNCRNAQVYIPVGNDWGKKIWLLLHTLSLKAGKQQTAWAQRDEMLAWKRIMENTGNMLPCPDCKGHYNTWLTDRKSQLADFMKLTYSDQVIYAQRWFFDLHNDVDLRLGKPTLTFEQFIEQYSNACIANILFEIGEVLMLYTRVSGYIASPVAFSEWKKQIVFLMSQ